VCVTDTLGSYQDNMDLTDSGRVLKALRLIRLLRLMKLARFFKMTGIVRVRGAASGGCCFSYSAVALTSRCRSDLKTTTRFIAAPRR
jgi:hypothetical protein